MLKPLEEMTPEDYAALGMKAGLEIHQQLHTQKKLFCRCPAGLYDKNYHAEILRHMRPTLSELGEYDGTALMEFKTKKEIIYQLNKNTVCTYEMDDAPPFELNPQALDIALEISLLLKLNIVSELHIARKQYLDGSIPTGFQRTTILGIDGEIPYRNRKIRIVQLGLEEDACREVSDRGHLRVYRTDRLGMPLIEVVTYPDMQTPQEMADVAQLIRQLTRATGKVNRGIGAARQDVNVSIEGGTRVEIKGVSRIPLIPKLVHNEAGRQKALLEIRREIRSRGVTAQNFQPEFYDVTDIVKHTSYLPIKNALQTETKIRCVKLPYFQGILRTLTQPATNFAKEISDRVRVIACLDDIPNIIHSDIEDETISSANWEKIKKISSFKDRDVLVIVWGSERDVETAGKEIANRAQEAIVGVPSETRQALEDGTTGFERILPGPDRMYPDTDLPPIALSSERIEEIKKQLPPFPWELRQKFQKFGLTETDINRLLIKNQGAIFDRICSVLKIASKTAAVFFLQTLKHFERSGLEINRLNDEILISVFSALKTKQIIRETVPMILKKWLTDSSKSIDELISGHTIKKPIEIENHITEVIKSFDLSLKSDKTKQHKQVMGLVMEKIRGLAEGKIVSQMVNKIIKLKISDV